MAAFLPALLHIPPPATRNIAVHVTPAAERAIRDGHPWLYADAIRRQSHEGRSGDLAVVFDSKRRFLAVGLYDPASPIRVRVLHVGKPVAVDAAWFTAKFSRALDRRAELLGSADTTGFRLIHGENDGFPGLVLDRFDRVAVLKLYTPAWFPHLPALLPELLRLSSLERMVLRLSRAAAPGEQYGLSDGQTIAGELVAEPVEFLENGLRFAADVVQGQKTGFFFDQRDNRAMVEKLAAGRSVLNAFAYTGAFSLYAARGGAAGVTSLDASRPALDAAAANFALNRHLPAVAAAAHEVILADAFQEMPRLAQAGQRFDMVIVDPPTLARSNEAVPGALAAYRKLTVFALDLLNPGGVLVMASCTARVPAATFFQTVRAAADDLGRPLQTIAETGQPVDHPITFKEGAYLKCLFAIAP